MLEKGLQRVVTLKNIVILVYAEQNFYTKAIRTNHVPTFFVVEQ